MRRLTILMFLAALFASCAPAETGRRETVVPKAVPGQKGTYSLVPFDETVAVGVFNDKVLEGLEGAVADGMKGNGYAGRETVRTSWWPSTWSEKDISSPTTGATSGDGRSRSGTPPG